VTDAPGAGGPWVLGVDSGGSGLRVALARVAPDGTHHPHGEPVTSAEPVPTGARGIDAAELLARLVPAGRHLLGAVAGGAPAAAVCVGAAGMATLGADLRAGLPGALAAAFGTRRLALAADAVTAYAGALGERAGTVAAAGTGMIALGTDLRRWRRADGWGHLLGDCGGGAWIGRAGLTAALRAHDGREGGSPALLARAEAVLGPPDGWPGRLYPRPDRAAVLASFAPEVAACATGPRPDPVAARILREAAREIAVSLAAVRPPAGGAAAVTGGLPRLGEALLGPLRAELGRRLPGVDLVPAAGDVLDGALLLAARLAGGRPGLPADGTLLWVADERRQVAQGR
jgi:N-acetylglucosamine kinase-like BadF-type ATPase